MRTTFFTLTPPLLLGAMVYVAVLVGIALYATYRQTLRGAA